MERGCLLALAVILPGMAACADRAQESHVERGHLHPVGSSSNASAGWSSSSTSVGSSSLGVSSSGPGACPAPVPPPTLDPLPTVTNAARLQVSGGKDPATRVVLHGANGPQQDVPAQDLGVRWSAELTLVEGPNALCAVARCGTQNSACVSATSVLDTVPPQSPGVSVQTDGCRMVASVQGVKQPETALCVSHGSGPCQERIPLGADSMFAWEERLQPGDSQLCFTAVDAAGNSSVPACVWLDTQCNRPDAGGCGWVDLPEVNPPPSTVQDPRLRLTGTKRTGCSVELSQDGESWMLAAGPGTTTTWAVSVNLVPGVNLISLRTVCGGCPSDLVTVTVFLSSPLAPPAFELSALPCTDRAVAWGKKDVLTAVCVDAAQGCEPLPTYGHAEFAEYVTARADGTVCLRSLDPNSGAFSDAVCAAFVPLCPLADGEVCNLPGPQPSVYPPQTVVGQPSAILGGRKAPFLSMEVQVDGSAFWMPLDPGAREESWTALLNVTDPLSGMSVRGTSGACSTAPLRVGTVVDLTEPSVPTVLAWPYTSCDPVVALAIQRLGDTAVDLRVQPSPVWLRVMGYGGQDIQNVNAQLRAGPNVLCVSAVDQAGTRSREGCVSVIQTCGRDGGSGG